MSSTILVTCDQCGHTISPDTVDIESAERISRTKYGWQNITYDYDRHTVYELRCPGCHLVPRNHPAPELTYVADPN